VEDWNMQRQFTILATGFVLALLTVVGSAHRSVAGGTPSYDELIAEVDSATAAFDAANTPSESFFLKRLAAAKKDLGDAKTQAAAGNKRGVSAELKNVIAALRGVGQRLNSNTGRKKIPQAVREALGKRIDDLMTKIKSLKRTK
jgi:hypothetical protein